jgi:hypothetical protein
MNPTHNRIQTVAKLKGHALEPFAPGSRYWIKHAGGLQSKGPLISLASKTQHPDMIIKQRVRRGFKKTIINVERVARIESYVFDFGRSDYARFKLGL